MKRDLSVPVGRSMTHSTYFDSSDGCSGKFSEAATPASCPLKKLHREILKDATFDHVFAKNAEHLSTTSCLFVNIV